MSTTSMPKGDGEDQNVQGKPMWLKWVLIVFGAFIVIGVINNFVKDDDNVDASMSQPTKPAVEENSYMGGDNGAQNNTQNDVQVAEQPSTLSVGQTFTAKNGVTITVNEVGLSSDALGSYVGANVTVTNGSGKQVRFSQFDWKIQNEAGVIDNATINSMDDGLSTGELAPDGTVTGTVYFPNGASGQYQLLWEPTSLFGDKATWVFNV